MKSMTATMTMEARMPGKEKIPVKEGAKYAIWTPAMDGCNDEVMSIEGTRQG
jgi:hypothetical protein